MNPDVKKIWVEALVSGKYKKGIGALRSENEFCCLGVLCDLYQKQHSETRWVNDLFLNEGDELPTLVKEWAGLSDGCGAYVKFDGHDYPIILTMANDGKLWFEPRTFIEIAKAIEEQL